MIFFQSFCKMLPMQIREIRQEGYEKVLLAEEPSKGWKAIISVHNTNLGPACGGIRMIPYATETEALTDVLRLSRAMSMKSSLAGIGFGGGKSVLIGDPQKKSIEQLQWMGEFIDTLRGKYIGAADMNMATPDLLEVAKKTRHVIGMEGVEGSSGDPSPVTARGVFRALEAALTYSRGSKSMKGLVVAIQGLGRVGWEYAKWLQEAGAQLIVTDINPETVQKAVAELGATAVALEEIYGVECDVFSPCARGAILNQTTIPQLECEMVVGAANNQLESAEDGSVLHELGILYAPDYAVNAGGIINIYVEHEGTYRRERALELTDKIYQTMLTLFERSEELGKAPFIVADKMAQERIDSGVYGRS